MAKHWLESIVKSADQPRHLLGGVDGQARHAAVSDAADRRELEPVHTAVPDAYTFRVQRLGDDHIPLFLTRDAAAVTQIGDTRESTAFFVGRCALLDCAIEVNFQSADRFNGKDRRRNASLLVTRAASVDSPITQFAAEWIDGPAGARRDHVIMPIEMKD